MAELDFSADASPDQVIDRAVKADRATVADAATSAPSDDATPSFADRFAEVPAERTDTRGDISSDPAVLATTTGGVPDYVKQAMSGVTMSPWRSRAIPTDVVNRVDADIRQADIQNARDNIREWLPRRTPSPMPQAEQTPGNIMRGAIGAFSNPLMWLAIAGSALTRRPAINALTAATGVLTGLNENDYKRAYLNTHKFRNSVKESLAQNQSEVAAYEPILNDPKMSAADQQANLTALAQGFNDQAMLQYLKMGDMDNVRKYVQGKKHIGEHGSRAEKNWDKSQARFESQATDDRAKAIANYQEPPDEKNQPLMAKVRRLNPDYSVPEYEKRKGEARRKPAPEMPDEKTLDFLAQAVDGGNEGVMRQYGWGAASVPVKNEVWRRVADLRAARGDTAGYNEAVKQFKASQAAERAGAVARATAEPKAQTAALTQMEKQKAAVDSFSNFMTGNFRVLIGLARKVDATGVPVIEKWVRAGRQATGDPDVAAYHFQWQATMTEVSRVLQNPNLTGVLPVSVRAEISEALPYAANVQQLERIYNLANQDVGRRKQFIDQEIDRLKGDIRGGGKGGGGAAQPSGGPQSREDAAEWLRQNPNDPNAADVRKILGQ